MFTALRTSSGRVSSASDRLRVAVVLAYYGGLCLLMALIVSETLDYLLPSFWASHIAADSEGYVLALLLPAWIEIVRPRLAGQRMPWTVTAVVAAASFAACLVLYRADAIAGTVSTLNETFLALAFLLLYIQPARRPSRYAALGCTVVVVAVVAVVEQTPWAWLTTSLDEGFVMLMLAPLTFDVFDRSLLEPGSTRIPRMARLWWVLLVLLPLAFIGLRDVYPIDSLAGVVDYATRGQEAFVAMLMISVYLTIRSPRTTHRSRSYEAIMRRSRPAISTR